MNRLPTHRFESGKGHRRKICLASPWVGLLAIAFFLTGCWQDAIHIDVNFRRLSGLAREDRVLFEDHPVGKVTAIEYRPEGIYRVALEVDEGYAHALTEHSRFYVAGDPGRQGHQAVIIDLTAGGGKRLEDGATVSGEAGSDVFARWKREMESGLQFLQEQIEKFSRDVQGIPESDAYQQLKRSLQDWAEEMERAGEGAREKIEREWLPRIQRELDALREQFKSRGQEERLEPLEKEVDRIRNI